MSVRVAFRYSQTLLYGHLIITDSFLCPWGKKAPSFNFPKFNTLNTNISLVWLVYLCPLSVRINGVWLNKCDSACYVYNYNYCWRFLHLFHYVTVPVYVNRYINYCRHFFICFITHKVDTNRYLWRSKQCGHSVVGLVCSCRTWEEDFYHVHP